MVQPAGAGSGVQATAPSWMPQLGRDATETAAVEAVGRKVAESWRIAARSAVSGRPAGEPLAVVVDVAEAGMPVVGAGIVAEAVDIAERTVECVGSTGIHRQSARSTGTSSSRTDRMMDCTPAEFGKLGLMKGHRLMGF